MVKEDELLFTITIGMHFWVLEEHEPLIIDMFLPILTRRELRGPWNVRVRELITGAIRYLQQE